ncbi:MAG: hypothetical protein WEC14_09600 [Chloroflexota bacterium]
MEIAAAILIVGGLTSLLSSLAAPGVVGLLFVAVNVLTVIVGVLVRRGRAWILAINVVAIALFLEVTALPSPYAVIFIVLDAIVLVALFRHRDWFFWTAEDAAEAA